MVTLLFWNGRDHVWRLGAGPNAWLHTAFPGLPMRKPILLLSLLVAASAAAQETVPQPAQSSADQGRKREQTAEHRRSFEAEPVYSSTTKADRPLKEEERIGDYAQPRWTAKRRFPTTRIYVVPAGTAQAEFWLEGKFDLQHPKEVRYRSQYELELGLGHRFQLDLYLTTEQQGVAGAFALHEEKIELRYALADWGKIPGNPTLYLEAVRESAAPPRLEGKLLLGDELAPRLHWGANLVLERQLGGEYGHEYALTAAVAYTVVDEKFSVGVEALTELVDAAGSRFSFSAYELQGGPSFQLRPVPAMHLDLVLLFGVENEAQADGTRKNTPLAQPLLVAGWEF